MRHSEESVNPVIFVDRFERQQFFKAWVVVFQLITWFVKLVPERFFPGRIW
jgi:hypothetical protein